jgi:hypothetical protein
VLWVNCVDLFWNAILASKATGDGDVETELGEPALAIVSDLSVPFLMSESQSGEDNQIEGTKLEGSIKGKEGGALLNTEGSFESSNR